MDNTLLDDNDPPRIKLCDVSGGWGWGLGFAGGSSGVRIQERFNEQQHQQHQHNTAQKQHRASSRGGKASGCHKSRVLTPHPPLYPPSPRTPVWVCAQLDGAGARDDHHHRHARLHEPAAARRKDRDRQLARALTAAGAATAGVRAACAELAFVCFWLFLARDSAQCPAFSHADSSRKCTPNAPPPHTNADPVRRHQGRHLGGRRHAVRHADWAVSL